MLDLIRLWNGTVIQNTATSNPSRQYPGDIKQAAINFDKETTQSSFEFTESPNVIFVKSTATLEPADFYDDLPEIILTTAENDARLKFVAEQKAKNPKFYDGQQMVVTGVVYDESANVIYMEAKKVPYSFIVSLSNKKFPENSDLYKLTLFKTGVLAPLISRNGVSILLQRAALGLYSVPGGFLEAYDKEKRLNFYDSRNLVIETATTELKEEIAGIKGTDKLRFEFMKTQISAISFRKTGNNSIKTVEFVAPTYVNCHSSYLQYVVLNNLAKDAREHTEKHELIPLDALDRNDLLNTVLTGPIKHPGASLYIPVALSLSRLENEASCMIPLPREIPNSSSVAWPLSMFKTNPTRSLPMLDKELDGAEYVKRFNTGRRLPH